MPHRIFVVDDHAITRKGYVFLLGEEDDLTVCGEAASARDALDQIDAVQPDLLIVDVMMDGMSGLNLVKHLQQTRPDLPILVVSMHEEALYAERALRAGARGYLMKTEASRAVVDAARRVLRGGLYVSESMNDHMLRQYTSPEGRDATSPLARLSDRELEAFEHLGRGLKTGAIAEVMHVSPNTVESYRARIKEKLGLSDGAALVLYAVRHVEQRSLP
ncbi:MAG: response regulator transcription factor [Bacteroidota bacterium]